MQLHLRELICNIIITYNLWDSLAKCSNQPKRAAVLPSPSKRAHLLERKREREGGSEREKELELGNERVLELRNESV